MDRKFELKRDGNIVYCISPFHPKFVQKMHTAGAKWDNDKKAWYSELLDEKDFRKAMKETYGRTDEPCEVATINLTIQKNMEKSNGPVVWGDRPLCSAKDRDGGAWTCSDVALIDDSIPMENGHKSGIGSGGSRTYWSTIAWAGTVFRLNNVPVAMIEKQNDDDRWSIEILNTHMETKEENIEVKEPVTVQTPLCDVDAQTISEIVLENFKGTVGDLKKKLAPSQKTKPETSNEKVIFSI